MTEYIDETALAKKLNRDENDLYRDLCGLIAIGKLKMHVLWKCDKTGRYALIGDHIKEFPETLRCKLCDHEHEFHMDSMEVGILDHPHLEKMLIQLDNHRLASYNVVMNEQNETVNITRAEHEQLLEDQQFLRALQAAGVDNWEGYSEAQEILEDE
jgi:hypothetical protein